MQLRRVHTSISSERKLSLCLRPPTSTAFLQFHIQPPGDSGSMTTIKNNSNRPDKVEINDTAQGPTMSDNDVHRSIHDLAITLSQIPWMQFNIVANPDLTKLASNKALQTYISNITSITILNVAHDIHDEVATAIHGVMKEIEEGIEKRMTEVQESIMNEIISVHNHTTATCKANLEVTHVNQVYKDLFASPSRYNESHLQKPLEEIVGSIKDAEKVVSHPLHENDEQPSSLPSSIDDTLLTPNTSPSIPRTNCNSPRPRPHLESLSPRRTHSHIHPNPSEPALPTSSPRQYIIPAASISTSRPYFPKPLVISATDTPGPSLSTDELTMYSPVVIKPTILPFPSLERSPWVWTPEVRRTPKPNIGHTRAFRRTLTSPLPVTALTLSISCDDTYTVYANGKLVGSGKDWLAPDNYAIQFPPTPKVIIAIICSQGHMRKDVGLSISGVIYDAFSTSATITSIPFNTDSKWVCYPKDKVPQTFYMPDFDDSTWSRAFIQNTPWRRRMMGTVSTGKAFAIKIQGERNIPDAPDAPVAELLADS